MSRAGTTQAKPHPDPAVQAFVSHDPDPELALRVLRAQGFPGQGVRKLQACALLLEATAGLRSYAEIDATVQQAYVEPSHADRHLMFLLCWIRCSLWRTPIAQIQVLTHQAGQLISHETPAELRSWIKFFHMVVQFEMGNTLAAEGCAQQVLSELPADSPHYHRLAVLVAMDQIALGKGVDAQRAFPAIANSAQQDTPGPILVSTFMGCAVTGNLDRALTLAPLLNQSIALLPQAISQITVLASKQWIGLMAQRARRALPYAMPEGRSLWEQSSLALLERQPERALALARTDSHESRLEHSSSVVGADQYGLVRAELACGNGEAAWHLLNDRRARGTVHYFDDFYWLRAQLLLGDRAAAARSATRLVQAVQHFQAQGRLEFEIALAYELPVTELIALVHSAAANSPATPDAPPVAMQSSASAPRASQLIYADPAMNAVAGLIDRFGAVDIPVLITGETGTGKELVARALHERSARRQAPYIEINCGALNEALIESELFGHQRGAFTGAQVARKGLFLEADQGTLLLDEIGEISPRLQVALLRVLETGDIRPLGGSESVQVHCRVIAATNADLEALVALGKFRADLLYRLKRLHLNIPPLRERPLDIDALATHFVNAGRLAGRQAMLMPGLRAWLRQQAWPGNVRELRNAIERMRVLNSDKLTYELDDLLPPSSQQDLAPVTSAAGTPPPLSVTPLASPAPTGPAALPNILEVLATESSSFRRVKRLRAAFEQSPEMKVQEAARYLGVTRDTASRYLQQLAAQGVIRKVCPNRSRPSHYYVLNATP